MPLWKVGFCCHSLKTAICPVAPSLSLAVSEYLVASRVSLFAQYLFLSTLDMQLLFFMWKRCVFKTSSFLCSCWKSTEMGNSCAYLHVQIGLKLWPASLCFYSAVLLNSNHCIPVWHPSKWTAVLECFLDHGMPSAWHVRMYGVLWLKHAVRALFVLMVVFCLET